MSTRVYIAGPFSTPTEKENLLKMIHTIRKNKPEYELYVPMEHKVEGDYQLSDGSWHLPNNVWAESVFWSDVEAIRNSDFVIAFYAGHRSTTGTAWEIGYAFAKGIPVYVYIPEESADGNFSLMIMNSLSGYMDSDGNIHSDKGFVKRYNQK